MRTEPIQWKTTGERFPWILEKLIPSPDFTKVAISSFSYESGGPVFIFNRISNEFTNLNLQLGLTFDKKASKDDIVSAQRQPWEVIGWHPDNQHLLLGVEGVGAAIWADLKSNSYQILDLGNAVDVNTYRRRTAISPDGIGFVYVNRNFTKYPEKIGQELVFYDLNTNSTKIVNQLQDPDLHILHPRFSPDAKFIAYQVESGHEKQSLTYSLRLLDLVSGYEKTLVEGDMGWTEPVWSPDGQKIALAWKDEKFRPGELVVSTEPEWKGNIRVINLATGEVVQLTFINGAARNPTWASDSNFFTFFTHDGQVGLTSIDNSGQIWQVSSPTENVLFGSIVYLP